MLAALADKTTFFLRSLSEDVALVYAVACSVEFPF